MALYLGLLIFSFIITGLLIVPFINILYKLRLTRRSEVTGGKARVSTFDKLHDWKAGTPVGGGILVVGIVAILFYLVFKPIAYMGVFVKANYNVGDEVAVLFLTFISFALLGLWDDLVKIFGKMHPGRLGMRTGLSRETQFILQWVLAFLLAFLIWYKFRITIINIPIFDVVWDLGLWYIPFAAFIIVSFVNAFNITDGLDGLASGLLLICLLAFWLIASKVLDTPLSIFISLWLGALIAFLYFNIWPARIFLGDTGALSFGATLAVVGLLTGKLFALVVIGGIFVVEVLSSLIQILGWRFINRPILPIAPLHLILQSRGWEEPKIVMRAWLVGVILAFFGLWLAFI